MWWLTLLRLTLATAFCASAAGKVPQPRQFAATVSAYRILPAWLVKPFAFALLGAEIVAAVLLFLGWQSRAAAVLCAAMLFCFTLAMGINLLRGRRKMDCGCFGSHHSQQISYTLILRDLALLAMAIAIMFWGGGAWALDNLPPAEQVAFALDLILPLLLTCLGLLTGLSLSRRLKRILLLMTQEER